MMFLPTKNRIWKKLEKNARKMKSIHMRDMFAKDAARAKRYTLNLENMWFDFSKNIVDDKTMKYLFMLAKKSGVSEKINQMFAGEKINVTENRAVLHVALRNVENTPIYVDGKNVMPQINEVLEKMRTFSEAVRLGTFKGYTGKKLTNIVNIGIGGSDLGPVMATEALKKYWQKGINCYFISNIDATNCVEVLEKCDPEETLFIVSSKTFTTVETLTNAKTCRKWLVDALGEHAVNKHFVAVSTNTKEVEKFGIDPNNMFEFWDFVGGRYSMWSAIGLSIAIAVGMDNFEKMLKGAHAMDMHFKNTDIAYNIPVIMALLGVWYNNFFGYHRYAVIPYDQYLHRLPAYLQQLDMESNGKSVSLDDKFIKYATGPVLFGEPGTNSQHSFFQLLHQGTEPTPIDFIVPVISHNEIGVHQELLLSNALAQAEALMMGKTTKEVVQQMKDKGMPKDKIDFLKKYKTFPGNRPSNTILIKKLDPYSLGMLLAAYEHKVFVQGIIWNINSYDQFGVELGKEMATQILPEIKGDEYPKNHDASTISLIKQIRKIRK